MREKIRQTDSVHQHLCHEPVIVGQWKPLGLVLVFWVLTIGTILALLGSALVGALLGTQLWTIAIAGLAVIMWSLILFSIITESFTRSLFPRALWYLGFPACSPASIAIVWAASSNPLSVFAYLLIGFIFYPVLFVPLSLLDNHMDNYFSKTKAIALAREKLIFPRQNEQFTRRKYTICKQI